MKLIDKVLEQIKIDIQSEDLTAIEELLKVVPKEYLVGYLSEGVKYTEEIKIYDENGNYMGMMGGHREEV